MQVWDVTHESGSVDEPELPTANSQVIRLGVHHRHVSASLCSTRY